MKPQILNLRLLVAPAQVNKALGKLGADATQKFAKPTGPLRKTTNIRQLKLDDYQLRLCGASITKRSGECGILAPLQEKPAAQAVAIPRLQVTQIQAQPQPQQTERICLKGSDSEGDVTYRGNTLMEFHCVQHQNALQNHPGCHQLLRQSDSIETIGELALSDF